MSDIDKTGKKLIDSLRKTKQGSDTEAVKAAKKAATGKKPATATKKATTKKRRSSAAKNITTPKVKAVAKKSTTQATRAQIITMATQDENPYPDGSQVWPD